MSCKSCRGMLKIIRVENDQIYSVDCPYCKEEVVSQRLSLGNFPSRYASVRFSNSKAPNTKHSKILQSCFEWSKSPSGFLILSGPPGSGKTHTMCCMAAEMCRMGIKVKYLSLIDLFDDERRRVGRQQNRELYLLESADILIVDELGAGIGTDFEKDIVHRIVARRYDDVLPTVFGTNFRMFGDGHASLAKSEKVSHHTMSRLGTADVFELLENFRGKK